VTGARQLCRADRSASRRACAAAKIRALVVGASGTGIVMQRKRAIAIAAQERADRVRLMVLASLLLLPAALLLLLISP